MLDVVLPPEYVEKIDIYIKGDNSRGNQRFLAKGVDVLIVPAGSAASLFQGAIPGRIEYDYDMIAAKPLNIREGALIKRNNGTELSVVYIDRVGNIQVSRLKRNR